MAGPRKTFPQVVQETHSILFVKNIQKSVYLLNECYLPLRWQSGCLTSELINYFLWLRRTAVYVGRDGAMVFRFCLCLFLQLCGPWKLHSVVASLELM